MDIAYDRQAYGWLTFTGHSFSWNLPALFGTPGAQFSGFALDPTGQYVIQAPVPVWQPSGTASWTPTAGTYGQGTDDTAANGQTFLRQTAQGSFSTTFNGVRARDGGFVCQIVRAAPAPTAGPGAFYVHFSANRAAGTIGLRLALVPGYPIRLQGSTSTADDNSWIDLAVASQLGECEQYLQQVGRKITAQVMSLCDPTWYTGLPQSQQLSPAPPPGLVIVTINGSDAVLTYQTDSLVAGQVRISGSGGQWSCRYAALRFQPTGAMTLPELVAPRPLQGYGQAYLGGYDPYGESGTISVIPTDVNKAYATLTLSSGGNVDSTGYSLYTAALSSVECEYPAIWAPPRTVPDVKSYFPLRATVRKTFDPGTWTVRHSAQVLLDNNDGALSPGPGNVGAVRAAQLLMGYDDALYPQITGYTGLDRGRGMEWIWAAGKQRQFNVTIEDKLTRGDDDQICCGKMSPMDGQVHYYAMRQLCHKLGITDDFLAFPEIPRNWQGSGYYTLPQGTAAEPLLRFPPTLPVGQAMQMVRRLSGAYDPVTGDVVPMVLGPDELGNIQYFGLPVGVVNALLTPGLTLSDIGLSAQQVYQAQGLTNADGSPAVNEILDRGLASFASLRHVRSPAFVEGLDPRTGGAVYGVAYNELVGGGPYSDPDVTGYVGLDVPFFYINRLISSPELAALVARLMAIQLAFPSIGTQLGLPLQPGMTPLTCYAVLDPWTQGTDLPVPYYAVDVASTVDLTEPEFKHRTEVVGHLLGQAAD